MSLILAGNKRTFAKILTIMQTQDPKAHPKALWALKVLLLGLGVSAVPPGMSMIVDPSGSGLSFPPGALEGSPFSNYFIPGLLLLTCVGLIPLMAWFGLWRKPHWPLLQRCLPFRTMHWAWTLSLASGLGLMGWITVQITMVPYFFLQPLMFGWGVVVVLLCLTPGVKMHFKVYH
jgi:hypothetical protein